MEAQLGTTPPDSPHDFVPESPVGQLCTTIAALGLAVCFQVYVNRAKGAQEELSGDLPVGGKPVALKEAAGQELPQAHLESAQRDAETQLEHALAVRSSLKEDAAAEADATMVFDAFMAARSLGCARAETLFEEVEKLVLVDLRRCVEANDVEIYRDGAKLAGAIGRAERLGLNDADVLRAQALQAENKQRGRRSLLRLASLARRHLFLLVLSTVFSISSGAVDMLSLSRLSVLLNIAIGATDGSSTALFIDVAITLLSLRLFRMALDNATKCFVAYFEKTFIRGVVDRLYLNMLSQDAAYWDARSSKELASFVTPGGGWGGGIASDTLSEGSKFIPDYLANLGKIGALLYLMFSKSAKLCAMLAVVVPVILAIKVVEGHLTQSSKEQHYHGRAKVEARVQETFDNLCIVRQFGREEAEMRKRASEKRMLELLEQVGHWYRTGIEFFVEVSISFSMYAVCWYGGRLVADGQMTTGDFMIFWVQMLTGFVPLYELGNGFNKAGEMGTKIEQVLRLLERASDMPLREGLSTGRASGKIEFDSVSFAYPSKLDVKIVDDLSFTIPAGETTAIVGPTGTGKSSILALAMRMYDPQQGRVLLDGRNIRDYAPSWLRAQIGVVEQEPVLFNMSVYENVTYGRPDATAEQVEAALRSAQIWEELHTSSFPQKLLTEVGESQKVKISGGQKQRLAIARALLIDPPVLVLDEGTSAMDANTEHEVKEALKLAGQQRTVLVVAHRISTVNHANILVLQKKDATGPARIVEVGSHAELLALGGVYSDLVKFQSKSSDQTQCGGQRLPEGLAAVACALRDLESNAGQADTVRVAWDAVDIALQVRAQTAQELSDLRAELQSVVRGQS